MKMRRLEIQGFKSFADRTTFDFGEGVCAVVGPNGCGKSNVVDAIKWVLGDMSPRSLRGKHMQDVIFAGSRTRKALGMAEVTLVMDNEDGTLPSEHSEVSITRRLHRSGESEYRINGQTARLKDIRELFLDTGLGADGNSIMEQGQIDALLAANPADRRGIFEEAAGISRYKQRRKEADQRLRRTHDNLERLRDVLELEEKRFRSLKAQASKARRYQALREELEKKRSLRSVIRYRGMVSEREEVQGRMDALIERETAAATDLEGLEAKAQTSEQERETARETVHALEARIAEAASDARAAQDRAVYASRHIEELGQRILHAKEEAEAARARIESIRGEITEAEAVFGKAEEQAAAETARVDEAGAELARIEAEALRIRDAHEGAKREALNALGTMGDVRGQESERRAELRQAEERVKRLEAQRAELLVSRERIEAEARELVALAAGLEEESRTRAAALEAAETRRAQLRDEVEAAMKARAATSEERATKAARLQVLEELEASREGVDAGARRIMEAVAARASDGEGARDGVFGLLADLISPTEDTAARLDRLLGHAAGAVVVRSQADALRWIAWLDEQARGERARFLCLDLVRGDAQHALGERGIAPGSLGCAPALERVVGSVIAGTVLVPDLPAGIQEWIERGVNAVTDSGERVTASGALLAGDDAQAQGLVERAAEIRKLREALDALERAVVEADTRVREADTAARESEEQIRRSRQELAHHVEDRSRRGEALARAEKERAHVAQGLEVLVSELAELEAFRSEAGTAAQALAEQLQALESERETLEERADEWARGYLAIDAQRKSAAERRMELRIAQADAKARAEAAQARVMRARDDIRLLEQRAKAQDDEAAALTTRRDQAEVEVTEAKALAKEREAQRGAAGDELVSARQGLEALDQATREMADRRREMTESHARLREELERFRVRDGEYRARLESLIQQVREEQDLDLEAVAAEAEASEDIDLDAMDVEVETLRRKLDGIGAVNLNAIAEVVEAEEQLGFLQSQERDLITGKSDLEKAIHELDELSTARFGEAFETIRTNFRETFRRLFGGGRAEILLEDASNLLESGIEIVARPPGKEQRTISLLSGGERTLTAVALLFAVFKAKPSPFSVLDEVDAALDEANVRRLVSLVQDFTDRCQFLIVTHAKATMEMADVLYGVTMEEAGVSKRVAVRLSDYPEAQMAAG